MLRLSLTVLKVELDGRSIGNLAEPDIKILSLPCLKKQDIVAVVKLGKLVQFVELSLGVELCVLSAVGEHRRNIIEKMAVSILQSQCQWDALQIRNL